MDANLELGTLDESKREIKLKSFFKGYKLIDLGENEIVRAIKFELPGTRTKFNFEKVSKRKYLDIATVNSACLIEVSEDKIEKIHLSIGGVAPVPLYLIKTCEKLHGSIINGKNIKEAAIILDEEISPISDVRGSAEYKRLLARQLFYVHFLNLFPRQLENFKI